MWVSMINLLNRPIIGVIFYKPIVYYQSDINDNIGLLKREIGLWTGKGIITAWTMKDCVEKVKM